MGVTAAAAVAAAPAPTSEAAAEEKDEFDMLTSAGDKKINVIKEEEVTELGLKKQKI